MNPVLDELCQFMWDIQGRRFFTYPPHPSSLLAFFKSGALTTSIRGEASQRSVCELILYPRSSHLRVSGAGTLAVGPFRLIGHNIKKDMLILRRNPSVCEKAHTPFDQ